MKTILLIIIGVTLISLSLSQALGQSADLVNSFNYNKQSCELLIFDQWQPTAEGKEWAKKILDECVKRGFITQELADMTPNLTGYGTASVATAYQFANGDIWKTIQLLQDPNFPINVFGSPYEQVSIGIEPENVLCKDGLELIFKSKDNSPACVTLTTKIELVVRGWAEDNRVLLGCTPTIHEKCYPSDPLEYRKSLYDYYFDDTNLPSSKSFDFLSSYTINACSDKSVCIGVFDNGTKIRVSCDYPTHGCGVKSFDDYKVENEN